MGGDTGYWYATDIAILPLGSGKVVVSTYLILENLELDPAADRLMMNIISFASKILSQTR